MNDKRIRPLWMMGVVLSLSLGGVALGQSLDELLDLDTGSTTAEPTQPQTGNAQPPAEEDDETAALRRRIAELREKAAEDYKAAANALEEAVNEMDEVATRLTENRDTSLPTQRLQEQIILKLDQMIEAAIEQARQQQQQQQSQGQARQQDSGTQQMQGQQPGQPSPGQSTQPQGTEASQGQFSPGSVTNVGDTQKPIEELRQEWGALPPRLRDELSEGIGERFSPVYRLMTEAYYRRLAEEAGQ